MLAATRHIKNVSVLRRMLFGATFLSEDLPNFWEVIVEGINVKEAKLLFQNMKDLDCTAFATDQELFSELVSLKIGKNHLVLFLLAAMTLALIVTSKLLLRKDRPAQVIVYDDTMGSVPGSHYHKYCRNRSCGFTQYYGYYTAGVTQTGNLYRTLYLQGKLLFQ